MISSSEVGIESDDEAGSVGLGDDANVVLSRDDVELEDSWPLCSIGPVWMQCFWSRCLNSSTALTQLLADSVEVDVGVDMVGGSRGRMGCGGGYVFCKELSLFWYVGQLAAVQ